MTPDATYFRLKARQCRELAQVAILPEVREQLALFADEFTAHADALDRAPQNAECRWDAKC